MRDMVAFVKRCIDQGNVHAFYTCNEWLKVRKMVLKDDKRECQKHKAKGKFKRATTVHHIKHLRDYPELALSRTYTDEIGNEQRQLISLCHECHEEEHPERRLTAKHEPLTPERW